MALGTIAVGANVRIQVATTTEAGGVYTPGTYSPVDGITQISRSGNRDKTTVGIFGRSAKVVNYGSLDLTYTLTGVLSVGDTGQGIVETAKADNSVLSLKVTFDGDTKTDGFTALVRVGGGGGDMAPDGNPGVSWELGTIADPVIEGDGPIW